jgi:hypothetical protein
MLGGHAISHSGRQEILAPGGEDLPRLWRATTTTSVHRKQIVRLLVKEVALDQKRRRGYGVDQIAWQNGSTREHCYQRTVQGYAQRADQDRLRQLIIELNGQQRVDGEIACILRAVLRVGCRSPAMWFTSCGSGRITTGKATNPPRWLMEPTWCRVPRETASQRAADRGATRQRHALADHADPRAGDRAPSQGDAPTDPVERHHESVESPM